jgi:hypothetical protein
MLRSHLWKQAGRISLWRYTENERNFPGWHVTADATGCSSLISLLDAFASDNVAVSRTVEVVAPTPEILAVPNNRSGRAAWSAPTKLVLSFSTAAAQWSFPNSSDPAAFTVGSEWLALLRKGIEGIPNGLGDYSIGTQSNGNLRLWFWWWPSAAQPIIPPDLAHKAAQGR